MRVFLCVFCMYVPVCMYESDCECLFVCLCQYARMRVLVCVCLFVCVSVYV